MKPILTINHRHFLLPDGANLNVIVKTLSKAVELLDQYTAKSGYTYIETGPAEVKIEMVDARKISRKGNTTNRNSPDEDAS